MARRSANHNPPALATPKADARSLAAPLAASSSKQQARPGKPG